VHYLPHHQILSLQYFHGIGKDIHHILWWWKGWGHFVGRGLTGPPLVDFLALKFHEDPISFPKKIENKNLSVETINKES
jgi:hypothetical protein